MNKNSQRRQDNERFIFSARIEDNELNRNNYFQASIPIFFLFLSLRKLIIQNPPPTCMFLIDIACTQTRFVNIRNNFYSSESDGFFWVFFVTINSIILNRDLIHDPMRNNTISYSWGQVWPPRNPQKWHDLSNNPL